MFSTIALSNIKRKYKLVLTKILKGINTRRVFSYSFLISGQITIFTNSSVNKYLCKSVVVEILVWNKILYKFAWNKFGSTLTPSKRSNDSTIGFKTNLSMRKKKEK